MGETKKRCKVTRCRFEFWSRTFYLGLKCEGEEEMIIELSYQDAEEIKRALNDMAVQMYTYKTGGFVDDY